MKAMPAQTFFSRRSFYLTACASLISLIFLCLAWELWLAPIRPGGSWLVLKCLPLLVPLFGILNGRRYTYQWASMLILLYLVEGLVRATSDGGFSQWLGLAEVGLTLVFFCSAVGFVRSAVRSDDTSSNGAAD